MTARQPTKRKPSPRPVVRVTIDVYPKHILNGLLQIIQANQGETAANALWVESDDYRRPRVVSVRRVRGGAK